MSKWKIAVSFCVGIGLLLPQISSGQTFTLRTAATWTNPDVPSSSRDEFRVRLTGFSPDSRTCIVEGLPADGAVRVGNCRWHQYVDGDFDLLLITLNWQAAEDVGTLANFGQFILLNDFGMGKWVRFFSSDGTKASVVAAASGPARSDPSGIPLVYTSALFVDRTVAASGDGTRSRPFKTIDEAVRAARPRTAIHIAAGTYNESVVIYRKNGIGLFGAARDAVRISNPGGFAVLCNASDIALYNLTLRGNKDGIGLLACTAEFASIAVTESSENGIVVANLDRPDPATASSLTLHNSLLSANKVGITVNHTSSLSAYGTAFERNAAHGVQVTSSGTVTLDECDISENRDGLNWKNANPDPGTLRMSNSTISDNARAGIILLNAVNGTIDGSHIIGNGYGTGRRVNGMEFYFSWRETFTISNSTFMNNASFGIFIASGSVTLENTVIDGNGQNGIGVYQGCGQVAGFEDDCTVLYPINVILRDTVIRNNRGVNISEGTGLALTQHFGPPMNITLNGKNEFHNNRKHVGCGEPRNKVALSCEEPDFSVEGVRVDGGVPLISTCAYSDVRGCLDAAACPEFCLPY